MYTFSVVAWSLLAICIVLYFICEYAIRRYKKRELQEKQKQFRDGLKAYVMQMVEQNNALKIAKIKHMKIRHKYKLRKSRRVT